MKVTTIARGAAPALAAFLASIFCAGAQAGSPPTASFPNTRDGKPIMQIGLSGFAYFSLEDPFLNLFRNMGFDSWAARASSGDMKFATLLARGYIDRTTMLPKSVPSGYVISTGLFRFGARYYPADFAGTYVVEWKGSATARCGFGAPTRKISPNRIECDYSVSNKDWSNIEFTQIGAGFSDPRLYRKEYEARIRAGETFNPRFTSHLHQYKVIRTMDVQAANTNWTRSVADLAKKIHLNWGQDAAYSSTVGMPRGAPIETLFDMAVASDTALWMHVSGLIGAPAAFNDPALLDGRKDIRALARANARQIMASPEWRKYADEIVRSLKVSRYPSDRMLYIEQSNEIWNFAHPFWRNTNYFWGLGEGLSGSKKGYSWALGYVTANFAVHFDAALRANGRGSQPWVAVLAGQMANIDTTRHALEGFKAYFAERRLNAAPFLARLGVSTASYYHGAIDLDGTIKATTESLLQANWLAAILTDPRGLAQRTTTFLVSGPESKVGTLPNLVRQRKAHQKLADEAGAFFLGDYEGESHEAGGGAMRSNPKFVNWMENWAAGSEGERMTKAWVEAMRKQNPNAVIANYYSIGARDPEGNSAADAKIEWPWIDNYYGEETGRTRALKPYLRQ